MLAGSNRLLYAQESASRFQSYEYIGGLTMGTTRRAIAVTEQRDQWLKASDRAWEIYERQQIYQRSEQLQTSDIEGYQSERIGSTSNSLS